METFVRAGRELRGFSRRAVKQIAATALEATGARSLIGEIQRRRAGGRRVQILAWHRVVPDFEAMRKRVIPGLLTSTKTFERQIVWLRERFQLGTMDDALDVLSGRTRSDRDLCVLTFDDGYADFVEHALPILQRHRVPSIVYVASAFVEGERVPLLHDRLYRALRLARRHRIVGTELALEGKAREALREALSSGDEIVGLEWLLETKPRPIALEVAEALERWLGEDPRESWGDVRLLGWSDLLEAIERGVEVGAHTVDHACLPNESPQEVERQLWESKTRIEERLGREVGHFAYPNGWYSPSVVRAVQKAGYRSAVTTEDRQNRLGENPLLLKRRSVWEYTSRGILGFSRAIHACNFDGTLGALGVTPWTPGEKPDGVGGPAAPPAVFVAADRLPSGA